MTVMTASRHCGQSASGFRVTSDVISSSFRLPWLAGTPGKDSCAIMSVVETQSLFTPDDGLLEALPVLRQLVRADYLLTRADYVGDVGPDRRRDLEDNFMHARRTVTARLIASGWSAPGSVLHPRRRSRRVNWARSTDE